MVKYEFSSKKTESRLPSREAEGPGPGEYNVIKPLIKPTFNQGKWKPKLPTESKPSSSSFSKASIKAKRDTTVRSTRGDDIISVSEQIPNVSSRVVNGPPSHRKEQTSSNMGNSSSRPRTTSYGSDKDDKNHTCSSKSDLGSYRRFQKFTSNTAATTTTSRTMYMGNILHAQRKKAASLLRSLVADNDKQLKVPVLKILAALEKVKLFAVLSIDQLRRLSYLLEEEEYCTDTYIIRQGDHGDKFFIILSGEVTCTINQSNGKELPVMELGAFDYFGEKAILESAPRAANVIATEDVKVLYIKKTDFEVVFGKLAELIKQDALQREENSPTRINYDVWASEHDPPLSPLPKKATNSSDDHHRFDEILDEDRRQQQSLIEESSVGGEHNENHHSHRNGDKASSEHYSNIIGMDDHTTVTHTTDTTNISNNKKSTVGSPQNQQELMKSSPLKSEESVESPADKDVITATMLPSKTLKVHITTPEVSTATSAEKKVIRSRRDSTSSDDRFARAAAAAAAANAAGATTPVIAANVAGAVSPATAATTTTPVAIAMRLDESMQGYENDFDEDDDEGWDVIH